MSGIAVSAVRQVHFVVSNDVPNDAYMRVVGELAAGAFGGAILFAAIASLAEITYEEEGCGYDDCLHRSEVA